MFKLLSQLLGAVAGAFAFALFITLNVYLTPFLGAWMFLLDTVLILGTLIFVSFMADTSIPLVRTVLRRSYYRIKFKKGKARKLSNAQMFYLKVLASLIVLFKSTEDGFEVIKDEAHIIHGKAILFLDKEKKRGKEVFVQLEAIHRSKQRRAATVSAMAITLFVMGSVLTALFSSLMYPNIFQSQAATYTWTQTSWAGGTSTAVAIHPTNQDLWTQYASADSNILIDGSGNITMSSGAQDVEQTTDADFNTGDHSWRIIVSGDSITRLANFDNYYDGNTYSCGDFGVWKSSTLLSTSGSAAYTHCRSLCSTCYTPTWTELVCLWAHRGSYNMGSMAEYGYWSRTSCGSGKYYGYYYDGSNNCSGVSGKSARCVRY